MVDEKIASGHIHFTYDRGFSMIREPTSTGNRNDDLSDNLTRLCKPGSENFEREPRIRSNRTKAAAHAAGKSARSSQANLPGTGSLTSASCQQIARK